MPSDQIIPIPIPQKGKPLENSIEVYLIQECNKYDILCYKFETPSQTGVPDRILIYRGNVLFVELKRPGKTPRPLQEKIIEVMRDHGAWVLVVDSKERVQQAIQKLLRKGQFR